ncbi:MAG: peptidoglycan-associated lipoprotein Pal [Rhodospirillales bacterium]|nr:peptidoglycan-associated lipoprotein Pal [Rhodospirillales bacterium]
MIKRNGYFLAAILFCLSVMAACSKNLMPPEGLDGTASVGSQMSQSGDSRSGGRGDAGRGFGINEESGSGFLSEENVGESARSRGFSPGGSDGSDGSALGGGRFQSDAEPFLGGSGSGGMDEARRDQDFKSTDNLKDIYFRFDQYDLDDQSRDKLRQNARYLQANSGAMIEIQGHCDERGTNNYNVALGERRAHSTKMYLVSQGISSRRIHTISYGEERPFCFDSNDACWLKNRRAHFRISE